MTKTHWRTPRRKARAATMLAAALMATGVAASSASAAVTLEWTQENAFASGCSGSGLNCTWLGHVTNPAVGPGARGMATASEGATLVGPDGSPVAQVDGTSARGAGEDFKFGYPAASGSLTIGATAAGWEGELEFDGRVSFVAPPPPAGHGFTITVDEPRVVLNGDGTGLLYATGVHTLEPGSEPVAYDDSAAIWELDLDGGVPAGGPITDAYPPAQWRLHADGTQSLSGIVPMIETAGHVFPATYAVGSGPNRPRISTGASRSRSRRPPGEAVLPDRRGPPARLVQRARADPLDRPARPGPRAAWELLVPRGRRATRDAEASAARAEPAVRRTRPLAVAAAARRAVATRPRGV